MIGSADLVPMVRPRKGELSGEEKEEEEGGFDDESGDRLPIYPNSGSELKVCVIVRSERRGYTPRFGTYYTPSF